MKTCASSSASLSALSAPGATAELAPRCGWGRFRGIPFRFAALALVLAGCTDTTVQLVEIDDVRVIPERVDALVSDQPALAVEVRDQDGNLLPDRSVDWASLDRDVVTVDASGLLTAMSPGQALVTATAGGALGSALVVVQNRPVIRLAPETLSVDMNQGASGSVNRVVQITNTGGATLNGLSTRVEYDQGRGGWMNAQISRSQAPADLTVTARSNGLGAGLYEGRVIVSSPFGSRTLAVSFRVNSGGPPPSGDAQVEVSPDDIEFRVVQNLTKLPDAREVQITNGGSGTLSGLAVQVSYQGTSSGWLWMELSSDTAPATLFLRPTKSDLALGRHYATVTVSSSNGGSETVEIEYRVREP